MKLPDLSYMMKVGRLRYIQSIYETEPFRNPDVFVGALLSRLERWACNVRGALFLRALRSQPFYFYVIARTKYYDSVFLNAIREGVKHIINVGCGSDTRAYRFEPILTKNNVRVLECDQPRAIEKKQRLVSRRWATKHVEYLPIDLNEAMWPQFARWLEAHGDRRILVLMEGVSPYVNQDNLGAFLKFLGSELRTGSDVAYDFKLPGVADNFGRSDRTQRPFRLSGRKEDVTTYHMAYGYRIEGLDLSADLSLRFLPELATIGARLFREDGLVRLSVTGNSSRKLAKEAADG